MSYVPESDICVKSYDHSIFSRASVLQFRASRYIMTPNRTSVWKRMTILSVSICDAPKADILVKSYVHLNFSRASAVHFRESRYIMRLKRTPEWKIMTIWISRELPLINFERLDILCAWIGPPSEKLWPFEFLESFRCSIPRKLLLFNFKRLYMWCAKSRHPS